MENIYELLPGILIFLFIIKKILDGFKDINKNRSTVTEKMKSGGKNQKEASSTTQQEKNQEISQERVKEQIYENI